MHVQNESGDRAERYLLRLRAALRKTPEAEKAEILSDIRCHIAERIAESELPAVEATNRTLEALGSPESLAQTYRGAGLMDRAAATFSPWLILRASFVWAMAGLEGLLALLLVFIGYVSAFSFLTCAVLKPVFPNQVGMWTDPPLFNFGIHPPSLHPSHELLGFWLIPLAFALAVCLFVLTTRLGKWLIRRFAIPVFFVSDMDKSDVEILRRSIRECVGRIKPGQLGI